MGSLTLVEFESQVMEACTLSPIVAGVSTIAVGITWMSLRGHIQDGSFVDVFFNQVTGKTSFAWIQNGQRVLGADNTKNWHWHLLGDTQSHMPVAEPVAFSQFIQSVGEIIQKRGT
jgi:hypothetical protein